MGELTQIGWTTHTFNVVWGCHEVPGDPACEHCYAKSYAKMRGFDVWEKDGPRRLLSEKHWQEPLKWDRAAKAAGEQRLVFSSSMADNFEDRADYEPLRERLYDLIKATPNLTWQLLTKRPLIAERFFQTHPMLPNIMLGVTAVTNKWIDVRVPVLLRIGVPVSFVSIEPIMEDVALTLRKYLHDKTCALMRNDAELDEWCTCSEPREKHLDWVIVGGESGAKRRVMDLTWLRNVVSACVTAKTTAHDGRTKEVPCFVKQDSHQYPERQGRIPDDLWAHKEFPHAPR